MRRTSCTGVCMWECWCRALVCAYYYYYYGLVGGGRWGSLWAREEIHSSHTNFFPSRTSKGTKGHDPGTRLEAWRELYHTHTHSARRERCEMSERSCSYTIVHHPSQDTKTGLSSLAGRPPNLCSLFCTPITAAPLSPMIAACQWYWQWSHPRNKIAN